MTPVEFFSELIEQQAARQRLARCKCGRAPVIVKDPLFLKWWVGCRVTLDGQQFVGCGIGCFALTEHQAISLWQSIRLRATIEELEYSQRGK